MKAYIEYCQENWRSMRNDMPAIDESKALLAKAVVAAGDDNIYRERINLLVTYTKPMDQLRARLAKGRDDSMGVRSLERDPKTVKLDGKLDDPMWKSVRKFTLRELKTGRSV